MVYYWCLQDLSYANSKTYLIGPTYNNPGWAQNDEWKILDVRLKSIHNFNFEMLVWVIVKQKADKKPLCSLNEIVLSWAQWLNENREIQLPYSYFT